MLKLFRRKKPEEKTVHLQDLVDRIKSNEKQYARVTYPSRKEPSPDSHRKDNGEDFGLSAAIGMATQNPLLGYAVGKSLTGAMVGASISESFTSSNPSSSSCDSSSSSYDTGSSFDSGSCGGSDSGSW